jgi:hypothetical protein
MTMTPEKIAEFEEVAKHLMKFLNDHFHPHTMVIVTPTSAELVEGIAAIQTFEFVKD